MARGRMIASDIFNDEFFCELTLTERLLWIGIIAQCADDQGRLQDKPNYINSTIFPDDSIQVEIINAGLEKFNSTKKIYRYSIDGKNMIQIVKWWTYQTPTWAMPSKYTAPIGWTDRIKAHIAGSVKSYNTNWDSKGGWNNNINPIQDAVTNQVTNTVTKPINELKRNEMNSIETKENERDAPEQSSIRPIQRMIEEITGKLCNGFKDIKAIDELEAAGVIREDIQAGYQWYVDQGNTFNYYGSIVKPAITAMNIRIQAVHKPNKAQTLADKNDEFLKSEMAKEMAKVNNG
jgi:hypothetical protein